MSTKPVWLLDIDGVINAAGLKFPTHAWPAKDWREIKAADLKGHTFTIRSAQPVLDFITRVHKDGLAEIRWHTTWQQRALVVGAELGLPEFAVAHAPEFDDVERFLISGQWWKLPAAKRVLTEEKRPLVWSDDDASWDLSHDDSVELMAAGPVLIVVPDPMTGLCRKHLRKIESFLADHA